MLHAVVMEEHKKNFDDEVGYNIIKFMRYFRLSNVRKTRKHKREKVFY